jgi:hypothetical protein
VARAAELLGLTNAALARTIGVSASRLRSGRHALDPGGTPYELALLLVRLFRGVDELWRDNQDACCIASRRNAPK